MQSLYLLIPVALVFVVLAVRFLFWAIKSGQYDDLNTEGHRILFDDEPAVKTPSKPQQGKPLTQTEDPAAKTKAPE